MIVVQGGHRYRLLFADPGRGNAGSCDPPDQPNKAIRIRPSLRKRPVDLVEVVIHECLHAQGWPLDEDFVGRAAAEITRVLERLNLIARSPI